MTAWVQIGKNGMITIFNPAAEMGQGSMTALAAIIAEELDADWNMVRIENAPVIPAIYGLQWGGKLGGPMMTVGSRTIKGYYNGLRLAGAQARKVLLQNVAEKWQVPIGDLITEPSTVLHKISGRKIGYGEIVSFAKIPNPLPAVTEQDLKDPATFRLVGHVMPRFASMSRSPINGTKPQLLNEKEVRESDGLIDIVSLDHGIAVVAKTYGQALKAKKSMQIKWSEGAKAEGYDSTKSFGQYQAMVTANSSDKIKVVLESGDAAKVIKSASKVYSGDYFTDYLCHAQMEPLNLVVSVAGDGLGGYSDA